MQILRIGNGSTDKLSPETAGAKAANLARMASLGLPVPPAFVLPVEYCAAIASGVADGRELIDGLVEGIKFLEQATGLVFGDRRRPLLVSVRSGAARSMPGMLDTVLNVGCTLDAVHGLIRMTGNPRFAWDCRRRFLKDHADVVLGLAPDPFERALDKMTENEHADNERALDGESVERLANIYQELIDEADGSLSENPLEQLTAAAEAVYRSWMSERARTYRALEHLDGLKGTAVTVQAMVFGNRGLSSGAGVAFSRDPSTGANEPLIEVLFGSQGEDVVSGSRNPQSEAIFARLAPVALGDLRAALKRLEREFRDVQDVEFTIENGKLWILQTRAAKRTSEAALRLAIDFVREGSITPAEALGRLDGVNLDTLTRKRLVDWRDVAGKGTPASAGIAVGRAAFDAERAAKLAESGNPVILVRPDMNTADVAGFAVAQGILAATGGRTSHAALVARQMGKPCVAGSADLVVDVSHHDARLAGAAIHEGDWLTIDGTTGSIYLGRRDVITDRPEAELAEVARWRNAAAHADAPAKRAVPC